MVKASRRRVENVIPSASSIENWTAESEDNLLAKKIEYSEKIVRQEKDGLPNLKRLLRA